MNNSNALADNPASGSRSRSGEVVGGLILILIGMAFLAGNFGIRLPLFSWHDGWALFILIGAVAPVGRAIDRYRNVGMFDAQVARSLLSAVAIATVALIFLLDASFGLWWPVFLVIGGLSMLVSGGKRRDLR